MSDPEKQVMVLNGLPELVQTSDELGRQVEKWGEQNHPDGTGPGLVEDDVTAMFMHELAMEHRNACDRAAKEGRLTWRHIFLEEVYEAMAESDEEKLMTELIQSAGVALQWVAAIKRRQAQRTAALEAEGWVHVGHTSEGMQFSSFGRSTITAEPPLSIYVQTEPVDTEHPSEAGDYF